MELILGIDLGTTNSVIYGWDKVAKGPRAYEIIHGVNLLPSVVSYYEGNWLVGQEAKNRRLAYPNETIVSIKRHMGTDYLTHEIGGKCWTPVEISKIIIQKLISIAQEKIPDSEIAHLVIAHPYDFDENGEEGRLVKDTLDAARSAVENLPEEKIKHIVEPTAAALTCGIEDGLETGQIILVFDMGGGTLDITVFEVIINTTPRELILVVKALGGDQDLGGNNFDEVIVKKFKEILGDVGVYLDEIPDLQRKQMEADLEEKAEEAKKALTNGLKNYHFVFDVPGHPPVSKVISDAQVDEWFAPLFEKVSRCLEKTVEDMQTKRKTRVEYIDHVLLVGGSTYMRQIRKLVKDILKRDVHIARNTAEYIAKGAAYYSAMEAGVLEGAYKRVILIPLPRLRGKEKLPFSLGMLGELQGEQVFWPILYRKTSLPASTEELQLSIIGGDSKDQDLVFLHAPDKANLEFFTGMEISEARTQGVKEVGRMIFKNVGPPNGESKDVSLSVELDNLGQLKATLKMPEGSLTEEIEIPMTES